MQTPFRLVPLGRLHAHALTFARALDAIEDLCARGDGGYVVTPNVDHVVQAEHDSFFAKAYEESSLSLVDGKPLVWWSRALGHPLPEKISGSDLVRPLMTRAASRGLSVFLLGGREGIAQRAADLFVQENPSLSVAGVVAPPFGFDGNPEEDARIVHAIQRAAPSLVLVALGAPRQELWMHKHHRILAPTVLIGVGGALDMVAGVFPRAPRWVSDAGLEWMFRLVHEPRRLARRYLVRDRAIFGIAWRQLRGRSLDLAHAPTDRAPPTVFTSPHSRAQIEEASLQESEHPSSTERTSTPSVM